MAFQDEPECLVDLALETFGEYVVSVCLNFLENWDEKVSFDRLLKTCTNIKTALHNSIPPSLVNDVTCRLLKQLDESYIDLQEWEEHPWYEDVIYEVMCSVIHPSTTILDFGSEYLHELYHGTQWNFILPFVCIHINTLKNLKQLRLGSMSCTDWEDYILNNISVPENLEEFTFLYNCNDNVIVTIANSCHQLKRLNVRESVYVTDMSVNAILKFKQLQQVNVEKTSLSETGVAQLLLGLSEKEVHGYGYKWPCSSQILNLGCGDVRGLHLEILLDNFPNLVILNLTCVRKCQLSALTKLENLKMLGLSYVEFPEIVKVLKKIGNQLEFLDICDVGPINVSAIGENCSSLRCLHITSSDTSTTPAFEGPSLPGFRSVRCLYLHLEYNPEIVEYVFSQCINVKVVDITIGVGNDNAIVSSVLSRNPLDSLQVLNWCSWSTRQLTRNTTLRIIEHCQNLTVFNGPYIWLRNGNVKQHCLQVSRMMHFLAGVL